MPGFRRKCFDNERPSTGKNFSFVISIELFRFVVLERNDFENHE